MKLNLNYEKIPVLGVGFSRGDDLIGGCISLARGGVKAMNDLSFPTHAFLITEDRTQKFATEETLSGLQEKSLEEYNDSKNRIVAMYYWKGWDDHQKRNDALNYLAEIRRRNKEDSKYDLKGLFSFILPWIKPDPIKEWCSENCTSIHLKYGAQFALKKEIAPDQLLQLMQKSEECTCILNYYKY